MNWLRKLRAWIHRDRIDAEMRDEMRHHLEAQTQRNVQAGMSPAEAAYAAQRQFGNVASVQEQAREIRGWLWLEQARQDLAYSARQLLRLPGFTATIVITLALGIGACTVVFTAINATLLSPLAGQAVNGAVIIHETEPPRRPQMQLSPGMFADVAEQAKSFEIVTAWTSSMLTMQTDAEPVFVRGAAMTPGLAENWSPVPALGRQFTAEEEARGDRVIMISHGLWQRSFRGSPDVLNRVIDTDSGPYTVIGVINADFAKYGSDVEFWTPWALSTEQRTQQRSAHYLQTNAKLRPGVTLAQAQAELNVIAANVARQYPDTNKGVGLLVRDMGTYINRSLAPMLYLLLAVVGCVLLIACSNVANLLLARATSRQREMAVRMALGAGRGRLVRQLLVESVMLATLGGAGGIVLAKWAIRFLQTYGPSAGTDLARLAFLELEPRVVVFTAGFSVLTGIVFGLAPAWFGSGVNHQEALKQGGHGSTDSKVRAGLRATLVVVEIALALTLLAGAGLLVRSFSKLAAVDPGFAVEEVATMRMMLSPRKYPPEARRQFVEKFLERVQALPGVEMAALANMTPFNTPPMMNLEFPDRAATPQTPIAVAYFVTPDYLPAMGIRLLRGRGFTHTDLDTPALALVVNETFVKQYFPDEDPIGRTVALNFGPKNKPTGEIVGVVRDVMQGTLGQPVPPQLYVPRLAGGDFHVLVRIKGDPEPVLPLLKSEVYALDKAQPVIGARTMAEAMSTALARSRLMLTLLGLFSAIAFILAAVGIYSVMAYAVGRRTTEFGVRMALGASRGQILNDVLRRGLTVVALGLVLGALGALALGQVLQTTLYEISPRDPVTLGASLLLLVTAGFLACLLPARRATKVDPVVALRAE